MRLHATRRAAIAQARGLGNPLWDLAGVPASLDLRFAESKSLVDAVSGQNLITFTRASDGTFVNSAGQIEIVAANVPRFTHDPVTGESLGLLVEEQRTSEVRNSSAGGAVAGSPGTMPTGWNAQGNTNGWSREVVGSGIDPQNGLPYVDVRLYGTPTTSQFSITFLSQGVASATNGQTWSGSFYYRIAAGSLGNILGYPAMNMWNSTLSFVGSVATSNPTVVNSTSYVRNAGSGAVNNASTAFLSWGITFVCTIGTAYDFTIRVAAPQLELGAFATSWIPNPSTSAAVTRSADVASISGSNFSSWYRQDEGTMFAAYDQPAVGGSIAVIDDGTTANAIVLFTSSVGAQRASSNMLIASANQGRVDAGGTFVANAFNKAALAVSVSGRGLSCNGSAVAASANPSFMPTLNRLAIQGDSTFSVQKGGTIRRLTFWPQRLPNSTLQNITL
jgi:hypothetical protein